MVAEDERFDSSMKTAKLKAETERHGMGRVVTEDRLSERVRERVNE